uniref:F-box associated domain-containing protein n=1 Tax=Fagus sylvatica TaxID=28930 RepID=A0A2N9JA45_FAGSY
MTKEWIALKPTGCVVGDSIGLAFYPFGYSSNIDPIFKLVSIQQSKVDPHLYSFVMYSSETGRWTTSKENHHILTFDVERELSRVIKLPGEASNSFTLVCSEGYLHYVGVHGQEFSVWMLKDYFSSEWVLKYQLALLDIISQESYGYFLRHSSRFVTYPVVPLAYHEDVLFMRLAKSLKYNFRSGKLKSLRFYMSTRLFDVWNPTVLLYSASLAAACFKEDPSDEIKSSGDLSDALSLAIPKRKRTSRNPTTLPSKSSGYPSDVSFQRRPKRKSTPKKCPHC